MVFLYGNGKFEALHRIRFMRYQACSFCLPEALMDSKEAINMGRFEHSCNKIAEVFGISGNALFAVLLGCAVRGKGDWTGKGVIDVIHLIKQGKEVGNIIEELTFGRSGIGLN
jgi:hypothetical protein